MIFIIGGGGFVGSAFARLFESNSTPYRVINKDNYHQYKGLSCDVLINANGNSKKFLANDDPLLDFDLSVVSVLKSLIDFSYKKYIFLSTGDVYPKQNSPEFTLEDQSFSPEEQSRYGLHKHLAEQLVRNYAKEWLIFRMSGFVGVGLKKNAIYDILTNSDVWISGDSELQYINTDSAAKIIFRLLLDERVNEVINLGSKGLVNISNVNKQQGSHSGYKENAPVIRYELNLSKLLSYVPSIVPDSEDEVNSYLQKEPRKN